MTSSIYLFPDTNVFLQCKALQEIDWRSCDALAEFDTIHLLVSLPVMSEIDKLKNRGNDRLGRRAREVNSILREIVLGKSDFHSVRQSSPTVSLALVASIEPTPDLLDYAIVDNRILGCVDAYGHIHRDQDVRFLTDDTGPMATAQHQEIPFIPVPDEWRRKPQPSAADRENTELKAEIKRLRQTEPIFYIQFLGPNEGEIDKIEGHCVAARSLTDGEVSQLLSQLQARFPRSSTSEWLEDCERMLRDLHTSIQHQSERLSVEIAIENRGVLPAKDALIEIVGHGPILLGVPLDDDDAYLHKYRQRPIQLPSPPSPFDSRMLQSAILGPLDYSKLPPRDPNTFYYKPERPTEPVVAIVLECKQWRHELATEYFYADVYVDSESTTIEGSIECRIHAENLSSPVREFLQVEFAGQPIDIAERAEQLVAQVVPRTSGRPDDFSISPY